VLAEYNRAMSPPKMSIATGSTENCRPSILATKPFLQFYNNRVRLEQSLLQSAQRHRYGNNDADRYVNICDMSFSPVELCWSMHPQIA